MSLVVAAEQFVLDVRQASTLVGTADHQEQVPVPGLHVENFNIGIVVRLDVKELTVAIMTDVDHHSACRRLGRTSQERANLGPGTKSLKLGFDVPLDGKRSMADFGLTEAQAISDLEQVVDFAHEVGIRHVVYSPVKIVQPRGRPLSATMTALLDLYRAMSARSRPVRRGGSWRLPKAVPTNLWSARSRTSVGGRGSLPSLA